MKRGDKVICTEGRHMMCDGKSAPPLIEGMIYTIRTVTGSGLWLQLMEYPTNMDQYMFAKRFRLAREEEL